jgi:hypothetical protein
MDCPSGIGNAQRISVPTSGRMDARSESPPSAMFTASAGAVSPYSKKETSTTP